MTEPAPSFSRRITRPDPRKAAAVFGACLAIVISAAVTLGASPAPSTSGGAPVASSAAGSSAEPREAEGSEKPDGSGQGSFKLKLNKDRPFAVGGIGLGRQGGVEITAINGSNLSLKTVDGWTRTITVESTTEITKAGATIGVADLKVGDMVGFRQRRNDDGTFTVTKIGVVLPSVGGTVTGKTGTTITIQARDGTLLTVHVTAATRYRVEGVSGAASLADVAIGMRIIASGEKRADGTLDAASVLAGTRKVHADNGNDHGHKNAPTASPSASP
jgi:Domain of unknown function (DUF5666)